MLQLQILILEVNNKELAWSHFFIKQLKNKVKIIISTEIRKQSNFFYN